MSSTNKRPLKVFLCHAHADREEVHNLYKHLKREGIDVWLDKENLLPGQDWQLEIPKAVQASDAVLVCLSNKSITKEGYVQKEIKVALDIAGEKPERTIFLIPARLEECEVPSRLAAWHWVDLFEEGGYHRLVLALRARAKIVGATLRNRSKKKTGESPSGNTAAQQTAPLSDKQTGRFNRSQYEAYNEVWNSLQDLRLIGDDLWNSANEKNLRAFAEQLRKTKNIAWKAELFLEADDRRDLISALYEFEAYSGGKGDLTQLRADSNIRDVLPESLYIGPSKEDINRAIEEQIKQNAWMKSKYEKVLDKIRASYRKRLAGFD